MGITNVSGLKDVAYSDGREVDFYKLINYCTSKDYNFINLNGPHLDNDKTRLVMQLARFFAIRNSFNDGVFYHDFKNTNSI